MCGFTLYLPLNGQATKTYTWTGSVWKKTTDFKAGRDFRASEIEVNNVDELAECLETLKHDNMFIVRGGLAYEAEVYNRRKQPESATDKPSLVEVARSWIMIDIDNWIIPDCYDLFNEDDHPMIIDAAVADVLRDTFADVRMYYQFSASCGLINPRCLKVHLWAWLDKPETNENLRSIFRENFGGVDCAPFSAVQPHYITMPILVGRTDPLPNRSGWRDGSDDAVVLPAPKPQTYAATYAANHANGGIGWLENGLAAMGDGKGLKGFYGAIQPLIWQYAGFVTTGDILRFDDKFIEILVKRINAAPKHAARDVSQLRHYTNHTWLKQLIEQAIKKHTLNRELSNAKK